MSTSQLMLIEQVESLLHESLESVSERNRHVLLEVGIEKIQQLKHILLPPRNKKDCRGSIRTQREACGLTTGELAELLDLDEDIIIQWENGKAEPLASQVIPLSNILDCDPMWLLTGFHSDTTKES
ncbi:helix-turn-helix domain-containing protein [Escherichia coli]|nr:helix-turn-helix domain-containing protein [Escherichia coli]EHP9692184.1 helix-turn-helix domain-containing protein [Escherichia coli]EKM3461728.1 helix-turn-helix domain-containing protein [Escherichia coli]EKY5814844.1 helix-turn-helix domain-containing protein [Escherichia coli]